MPVDQKKVQRVSYFQLLQQLFVVPCHITKSMKRVTLRSGGESQGRLRMATEEAYCVDRDGEELEGPHNGTRRDRESKDDQKRTG
jgi:hypothetical protein